MAAMGDAFPPEPIAERSLPDNMVNSMTAARTRLIRALLTPAASSKARTAARAQAMFDCWMQEQEENFQPGDIAACRAAFTAALAELEYQPKMAMMEAAPAAPAPKPMMKPMLPNMNVYFGFDSFDLSGAAMATIKEAAMLAKKYKAKVFTSGHTDSAGASAYNKGLARARTNAVGNELLRNGLKRPQVVRLSYGEAIPRVKTGDNVKESSNRRVVIQFSIK